MIKYLKPFLIIISVFFIFTSCSEKSFFDFNYFKEDVKPKVSIKHTDINDTKQTTNNIKIDEKNITTSTIESIESIESQDIVASEINTEIKEKEKVSYTKQVIKRVSSIATKESINKFDFDIIKKGFKDNNTLLIVGGIQGDEPGGFMAASLIATHYNITKGSVWVIPNLNFYSIIKRSRGPYGDMNRKFADLKESDPEYETVQRIKSYIDSDDVQLIVNLHDGSGFYRPTYEDKDHSPYKWGQCSIIDQEKIKSKKYSNLLEISDQITQHVNKNVIKDEHIYYTYNTKTAQGDKEMEKTLTFYAIKNGKAAFGNEASKSLPTHERIYYHLLALEKYMQVMGIEYERKFNLNEQVIKNIIDNDIEISLYDEKIKLPLAQIRNIIKYFPVTKDGKIDFIPSNPLMSIVKERNEYTIYYGNRRLSKLQADFMEHSDEIQVLNILTDGKKDITTFGSTIKVKDDFIVKPIENYRINVIGYTNKSKIETNKKITLKDMMKRFSIDKKGLTYRVEYYTNKKFAGMILVEFMDKK
ncbi:MAG: M99 family carboxypeptidase catalytic domain-containing protein [Campylobacterota bacterium]|nr:M99 family carboxypeptidase catalytic domain-containing protein [Campylobacterota bacterium]